MISRQGGVQLHLIVLRRIDGVEPSKEVGDAQGVGPFLLCHGRFRALALRSRRYVVSCDRKEKPAGWRPANYVASAKP